MPPLLIGIITIISGIKGVCSRKEEVRGISFKPHFIPKYKPRANSRYSSKSQCNNWYIKEPMNFIKTC